MASAFGRLVVVQVYSASRHQGERVGRARGRARRSGWSECSCRVATVPGIATGPAECPVQSHPVLFPAGNAESGGWTRSSIRPGHDFLSPRE
jgi:hypothetical protein